MFFSYSFNYVHCLLYLYDLFLLGRGSHKVSKLLILTLLRLLFHLLRWLDFLLHFLPRFTILNLHLIFIFILINLSLYLLLDALGYALSDHDHSILGQEILLNFRIIAHQQLPSTKRELIASLFIVLVPHYCYVLG